MSFSDQNMNNIKDMSTDDIENRISAVSLEIAKIKSQIEIAKSTTAATGKYSDREWFNKAHSALRFKGIEHQELLLEFGKRRKQERREYEERRLATIEKSFIIAAKARLDHQIFDDLMEEAKAISKIK